MSGGSGGGRGGDGIDGGAGGIGGSGGALGGFDGGGRCSAGHCSASSARDCPPTEPCCRSWLP